MLAGRCYFFGAPFLEIKLCISVPIRERLKLNKSINVYSKGLNTSHISDTLTGRCQYDKNLSKAEHMCMMCYGSDMGLRIVLR